MMIERAGLQVDETLAGFIEGRALPGSDVDAGPSGTGWQTSMRGLRRAIARCSPSARTCNARSMAGTARMT